jgi:osmoprotectant transport system permease protein
MSAAAPRAAAGGFGALAGGLAGLAALGYVVSRADWWEAALRALFPVQRTVIYPQGSLAELTAEHLVLVGASSGLTILIGLPLAIFVTRGAGREWLPVATSLTAIAQTFPPAAVLALTYPILGFGFWPAIVALFLYGLLPVVRNAIAAFEGVDFDAIDAARGMGMTPWQVLTRVELPLGLPLVLAGIRTSVVINVGTAAIGAAIGAGGLGVAILGGLEVQNLAYVVQGSVPAAALAILLDAMLGGVERVARR